MVTFLLSRTPRPHAVKIQKYEERTTRYDVFLSPLPPFRNPSRGFSVWANNRRWQETSAGPLHFLDAPPLHTPPCMQLLCIPETRPGRGCGGGKCSTKISGIPNTIGSTRAEARKGIHHPALPRVRTLLSPSLSSSLLYFPNNGPLKSNFANISARQLCLLPFRSFPRGKETRAKSRTRGNFFGNRCLSRIVATIYTRTYLHPCTWKYAHDREGIREASFRCREISACKKKKNVVKKFSVIIVKFKIGKMFRV